MHIVIYGDEFYDNGESTCGCGAGRDACTDDAVVIKVSELI